MTRNLEKFLNLNKAEIDVHGDVEKRTTGSSTQVWTFVCSCQGSGKWTSYRILTVEASSMLGDDD